MFLFTRSIRLLKPNQVFKIIQVKTLYNEASFGLNHFIKLKQQKQKEIETSQLINLKQKLTNSLKNKNVDDLEIKDLNEFVLLSNHESDQDLACDVFKLYLKENYLNDDKNFGELLIKNDYILNSKTSTKAIELLNDKYIQASLMTQITTFALMIKFYNLNNHDQVYSCFQHYLNHLEKQYEQISLKPFKFKLKSQRQLIPFGHLRLVTASLLQLNSDHSLARMKEIIQKAGKFNSHLNNTSLASCFLLSIQKNDLNTAHKMVSRITTRNSTLKLNLETILHCYENDLNLAVSKIDSLIKLKHNKTDEFNGKLFKLTQTNFEQLLKRTNTNVTRDISELLIKTNNRLFKLDLFEYCTLIHSEFNNK